MVLSKPGQSAQARKVGYNLYIFANDKFSLEEVYACLTVSHALHSQSCLTHLNSSHLITSFRVFGRLVLVPFLDGRRSPNGLEAQQRAELRSEEVFSHASSALGALVGFSYEIDYLLRNKAPEVVKKLVQSLPELDDRCAKNYALLICLTEKVFDTMIYI